MAEPSSDHCAQVNILDAIEDEDFCVKIVQRYTEPDEKIIVLQDGRGSVRPVPVQAGSSSHHFQFTPVRKQNGRRKQTKNRQQV